MNALFAMLFYLATLLFVVGLIYRIWTYASTPSPLKIPTTPAPITTGGVLLRMAREVVFFESLFKANLWIWVLGWLFHASLALVIMRHLRYFTEPVWGWVTIIQPFGIYAGISMLLGLCGLYGRRLFVERIRYISTPSDYLMLALLICIAASGLMMKFVVHTDVVTVKSYFMGLMSLNIQTLPADLLLLVHLFLVVSLLVVFPFSKLLHAPGVFFSPTRNQKDDSREKRHISAWAKRFEANE
jgi:nitrate reductase gamma subunit